MIQIRYASITLTSGPANPVALPALQLKEVYELLSGHYVEDDDASFRFKYSAEFLKWCVLLDALVRHQYLRLYAGR